MTIYLNYSYEPSPGNPDQGLEEALRTATGMTSKSTLTGIKFLASSIMWILMLSTFTTFRSLTSVPSYISSSYTEGANEEAAKVA